MPKMMQKFDAENEAEKADFGWHFDSPGGRREVRRASLRRRRFADAGLFSLKRLTPAGVGGFSDPLKSENGSKIVLLSINRHFGPPKIDFGGVPRGGRKKHEKSMENGSRNRCFLMAPKHQIYWKT